MKFDYSCTCNDTKNFMIVTHDRSRVNNCLIVQLLNDEIKLNGHSFSALRNINLAFGDDTAHKRTSRIC